MATQATVLEVDERAALLMQLDGALTAERHAQRRLVETIRSAEQGFERRRLADAKR